MRSFVVLALAAPLGVLPTSNLHAADLLQVFRDATANDATYTSARFALAAGRERLPQGRALTLPTVNLTGTSLASGNRVLQRNPTSNIPVNRNFSSNVYTITMTQPLYRPQNTLQFEQAEFQVAQAEAQFSQAFQDLVVRVSQAYFDVLNADNSLAFVRAQKAAITEQLAQARRNFEVGTTTITDTNEAQARFDLSVSQEIAALNELELRKQSLQQIVGKLPEGLTPLRSSFKMAPPAPSKMDDWVEAAQKNAYTVRIQEAATEIAAREVERARAGHKPTLDLIATVANSAVSSSVTNGIGADTRTGTLGVQLAFPIFAGFSVDSRIREALANLDRSRSDLESNRRQAATLARQSYVGVTNGMAQVRALEQAVTSSETALASNKLGYEVGVRINIDVLNSQQQLFSTKRDLARARYDTIMNGLRLKAAAGSLSEEDVEAVNRLLGED
ncbi:MAG: TolC family outer membrane protein [Burkholderiales bacterium]